MKAEDLIERLALIPHPEGGAFREVYRAPDTLPVRGGRAMATSIFFLLRGEEASAWHRVQSDELWFFHGGDPLLLKRIGPDGYAETWLGLEAGQAPQALIPAGHWQAARSVGPQGWTLVGCVVVPGFDFQDFELATEADMLERFPELAAHLALRS